MNYRLCWGWCTGMSQPEWVGHFYSTCNETRWCSDSLRGFQSQCTPSVGVRTIPSTAHRWFVCKFGWRERNSSKLIPVRHTCKCVLMRTRELLTPVTHRSLHRHCRLAPAILFCTIKSQSSDGLACSTKCESTVQISGTSQVLWKVYSISSSSTWGQWQDLGMDRAVFKHWKRQRLHG